MGDRVIYSQEELQFNFRLIMLLDKDYEPNEDERSDKAFKHMGENPDDEARFDLSLIHICAPLLRIGSLIPSQQERYGLV